MTQRTRTLTVVAVVGLLVVTGAVIALVRQGGDGPEPPAAPPAASPSSTATTGTSPTPTPSVTVSLPAATTTAPVPTPSLDPESPHDDRARTDVQLAFAEWNILDGALEASAFAQVYESDGVCTLVATSGGTTVTSSREALADVTTTSCGVMQIARAELAPGTWQVHIEYASARTAGASAPVTVEVP